MYTISRSVTPAGSCPKSICMSSCSCGKGRACERGLYLRAGSRNACNPIGCCRMLCSAGPLVNMTSRYLSCASMSWFNGSLGNHAFACVASSASIILPSWKSTTDTYERNLKLQSPHVFSSPENTGGFPILVSTIPRPAGVACGGGLVDPTSTKRKCRRFTCRDSRGTPRVGDKPTSWFVVACRDSRGTPRVRGRPPTDSSLRVETLVVLHECETIHPLRRCRVSRCSWYSMSERPSTTETLPRVQILHFPFTTCERQSKTVLA